jgi:hypothetical protein
LVGFSIVALGDVGTMAECLRGGYYNRDFIL